MAHGIDHLVLASHDLDAQADIYRRLGFTVGARNRHAWGTLNHIIQFPGTFLELIATEPGFVRPSDDEPVAQFAGFIADYLRTREGFAMLVLESPDATADQSRFERAQIAGPSTFFFERRGKRPDGSDVHVAFTLAFARARGLTEAGFFVCQQHFPERFWNPAFQTHANTVMSVASVSLIAVDPAAVAPFVVAYTGASGSRAIDGGFAIDTPRGSIEVVKRATLRHRLGLDPGQAAALPDQGFAATTVRVSDMVAAKRAISAGDVAHQEVEGTLVVAPDAMHGTALVFSE